jgi:DNA-binding NtrC family response regulator
MEAQQAPFTSESSLRCSVLVVDDDEPTCHLLSDCVRLLGFDATIATSARQALALMRERPAQVVFCDIVMPEYDGAWLIEQIGRRYPGTAVVIATGLTTIDPSVTSAPCVAAYLVKPFQYEDIAAALGSAVAAVADGYGE